MLPSGSRSSITAARRRHRADAGRRIGTYSSAGEESGSAWLDPVTPQLRHPDPLRCAPLIRIATLLRPRCHLNLAEQVTSLTCTDTRRADYANSPASRGAVPR